MRGCDKFAENVSATKCKFGLNMHSGMGISPDFFSVLEVAITMGTEVGELLSHVRTCVVRECMGDT
ncbi:unnamed protein product [Brugia pahangi]|uniref:Ornithine transcarbamylase n=1 Tax=Brugia pahangi TaxID=6280 RepID=A0A0N4TYN2_BRUPA|nr:unnamed protein product [Brugia pahangi]